MNKKYMLLLFVMILNAILISTAWAEEQPFSEENDNLNKTNFKSKFIDPEIYIPSFDANLITLQKSSCYIELKGDIPLLNTSEERSEYLNDLDAIRLDIRQNIEEYLYPNGPVIGYGWNINGSFEVTYYENISVKYNTTDEIYDLIQKEAKLKGIDNIPVLFEQKDFLKTTSSAQPGYDVMRRHWLGESRSLLHKTVGQILILQHWDSVL